MGEKIKRTEYEKEFDRDKAKRAVELIPKIRKSKVFDKGKSSIELIREWRDKRK
ncbi:hypothetical protein J4221_07115 [Candidatus Pacearchaeota archaeon]|nr:hypothetical protein [Candidatus Pacearchaeota archaeon]